MISEQNISRLIGGNVTDTDGHNTQKFSGNVHNANIAWIVFSQHDTGTQCVEEKGAQSVRGAPAEAQMISQEKRAHQSKKQPIMCVEMGCRW